MFRNIGKKIKGLAKFLFWFAAIMSILGGLSVIIYAFSYGVDGEEMLVLIIIGIGIAVGGFLLAWLSNFILYGFGELVDTNQRMLEILEEGRVPVSAPPTSSTPTQTSVSNSASVNKPTTVFNGNSNMNIN